MRMKKKGKGKKGPPMRVSSLRHVREVRLLEVVEVGVACTEIIQGVGRVFSPLHLMAPRRLLSTRARQHDGGSAAIRQQAQLDLHGKG